MTLNKCGCGGTAKIETVGRDWYRLRVDHVEGCYYEYTKEPEVPQNRTDLALLIASWNTAHPLAIPLEKVREMQKMCLLENIGDTCDGCLSQKLCDALGDGVYINTDKLTAYCEGLEGE